MGERGGAARAKNTSVAPLGRGLQDNAPMLRHRLSLRVALTACLASVGPLGHAAELDEVVVTALRRPQAALAVSGSLSSVSPNELGVIDLLHAADAINQVPGAYVQRGSGQESLTAIRSPVLAGAGACGAFLILEDGTPIRPVGFCNVNQLFEINTSQAAGMEVLRGPGTAVLGANAVHGTLNVLTPAASAVQSGLGLTLGSADFSLGRFSLRSDAIHGLAVYGNWRRDGGFRDHSTTRDAKFNLAYDANVAAGTLRVRASLTQLRQQTAGFLRGFDAYRDPALRRTNANPEAFRDADAERVSLIWNRDTSARSDELRLALRRSSMSFLQHFLLGKPLERNGQDSATFSYAHEAPSPFAALRYRLGIDAETAQGRLLEVQDGPTLEGSAAARAIRPAGRHYDYAVRSDVIGVTAALASDNATSQRFDWRLSVRADRTRYGYDDRMRDGNVAEDGSTCGTSGCLYSRPADRTDRFDTLTPRLETGFRLAPQDRLYALVSDGFRPPEATELYRLQRGQSVADLDSERMRAREIGWRHVSKNWRASIALYDAVKRNVILRDANGYNVTGGSTSHRGVEYEIRWLGAEHWSAALAGTRARHRYEFSRNVDGGEIIRAGNDIDTAPRALDTLTLQWQGDSRWRHALVVHRVGDYFADAANERRQPGHTVADLRSSFRWQPGLIIGVDVTNLADRLYADRADYAMGEWRYFPAPRRSVFITLDWRSSPAIRGD
jgi:iron complex outermembrane receptor protein